MSPRLRIGVAIAAAVLAAANVWYLVRHWDLPRANDHATPTAEPVRDRGEDVDGGAPRPPVGPPAADARDQYALLLAIEHSKSLDSEDQRAAEMARVREDWSHHRIHWEMLRIPGLCLQPDNCHVTPFDFSRHTAHIYESFMPRLVMTPEEYARGAQLCTGKTLCVMAFDATITELALDVDVPTHVILGDVHVAGAREAGPNERWNGGAP